jgi:2-dehydro-3-deoxyphosphogluconate aldolase / (4S)-4-hydroxy-2-oxoglutarate aldolase
VHPVSPQAMITFLDRSPVIPVVEIADARHALPVAEALVAGGITIIEIVLRTPAALESVRAVAREMGGRRRRGVFGEPRFVGPSA